MIVRLDDADPDALAPVLTALRDGQVVAIPTDTVYGLAVDPPPRARSSACSS